MDAGDYVYIRMNVANGSHSDTDGTCCIFVPSHAQYLCLVLLLATMSTCIVIATDGLYVEVTVSRTFM